MSQRYAVLVTGSRMWRDYAAVRQRLQSYPEGTILIHGDNGHFEKNEDPMKHGRIVGADWICADVGRQLGFVIWALPFFADKGRAGGPIRNSAAVDHLALHFKYEARCFVEGFAMPNCVGTVDCLEKARRKSKQLAAEALAKGTGGAMEAFTIHVTEGLVAA